MNEKRNRFQVFRRVDSCRIKVDHGFVEKFVKNAHGLLLKMVRIFRVGEVRFRNRKAQ